MCIKKNNFHIITQGNRLKISKDQLSKSQGQTMGHGPNTPEAYLFINKVLLNTAMLTYSLAVAAFALLGHTESSQQRLYGKPKRFI